MLGKKLCGMVMLGAALASGKLTKEDSTPQKPLELSRPIGKNGPGVKSSNLYGSNKE